MSKRRQTLGARGERLAADHLLASGYKIIDRNYRCQLGEIDIVARKNGCLIICEVKTRLTGGGHPLEAVTPRKQERLRRLGEYYWQFETDRNQPIRFDVLAVLDEDEGPRIDHIMNAF